jgi:hypothetical protein
MPRSSVPRRFGRCSAAAALAVLGLVPGTGGATVAPGPRAHAATTQDVKEHVDLKLTKKTGGTKFEHAGKATGTIPGSAKSKITITHVVVLRGTVTVTTPEGKMQVAISGRAQAIQLRTKFSGTVKITAGTGRYKNATGSGRFTGVINRSTWHVTVDATGSLTY